MIICALIGKRRNRADRRGSRRQPGGEREQAAGVHGSDGDETSNRQHGSTARDKTTAADRGASGTARAIQVKSGALHRRAAQVVGALAPSLSQPAASLQISWGKADRSEVPARAPCAMPDCTPAVTFSAPRMRPRPAAESARTATRCPRNAGEHAARRLLIGYCVAALRETLPRALCMHSRSSRPKNNSRPACLWCAVIAFALAHLCFSDLVQAVRTSPYLPLIRHAYWGCPLV